jgi:eukaryotic-like serine/threonine-protein kinase
VLAAGHRLGPYEILSVIGAGGMGEVYRAKDTRLDRTVAIKVLPTSDNADHRARFAREARAISTLSDPHICSLYDVGQQDGIDFLVMEFLQGETLAEKLLKGPLPGDQVLQFGIEIAGALHKAHKEGIIHRDLKPGNIMLTKSGIKLLDFGLAKMQEASESSQAISQLGTEQADLTVEGAILGTIPYMSPEQLESKTLDVRTDIFSFGAVLYEMATGRRAFSGKSKASLITAILRDEPQSVSIVQPTAVSGLDYVVKTCLNKDPDLRWQSAEDIVHALNWIKEGSQISERSQPKKSNLIYWIIASLFAASLLTFLSLEFQKPKGKLSSITFQIPSPPGTTFGGPATAPSLAISPDGTKVAFVAAYENKIQTLWIRDLNSLNARSLAGTEGAYYPFWSPDGQYVAYSSPGKISKVNPNGGPSQFLYKGVNRGGTWSNQGNLLFGSSAFFGIVELSSERNSALEVTKPDHSKFEAGHSWPSFLPDGQRFLYFVLSGGKDGNKVYAAEIGSGKTKLLFSEANSFAAFSQPGYLLFVRGDSLMAQRFDPKSLEFLGETFIVAANIGSYDDAGPTGYAPFSVSNNGVLAFGRVPKIQSQPVWVDRTGKEISIAGPVGKYSEPALSPDEKQVSIEMITEGETDIWLIETSRSIPTRFTNNNAGRASIWSPDGKEVIYISEAHGGIDFYARRSDGSGEERPILQSTVPKIPDDLSRDGHYLVYEVSDQKTGDDLWILPIIGNGKSVPFLVTEHNETNARFSPDGQWIAFTSDESGQLEVYIQAFGNHTGKWRVSSNGGRMPRWRADGKELFYVVGDSQFMAVPIEISKTLKIGNPVPLFRTPLAELGVTDQNRTEYDVSADGKRFLINKRIEETTSSFITVVTNWYSTITAVK